MVENKPGAGGNIGTATVARSDSDGHTVLMAAFTHAVNVFLYRSIGYDPVVDFEPATLLSREARRYDCPELLAGAVGGGVHRLR